MAEKLNRSNESGSKIAAFLPARQLWAWAGKGFKRSTGRVKKQFYRSIQRGKETISVSFFENLKIFARELCLGYSLHYPWKNQKTIQSKAMKHLIVYFRNFVVDSFWQNNNFRKFEI